MIRAPRFPSPIDKAPAWVQQGIADFAALQRKSRRDLGSDPSTFVRDGSRVYFPNAVMHWHVGMIGVIAAFVGVVGFATVALVGLIFGDGVATWSLIGLGVSFAVGLLSLVTSAFKAPNPKAVRRDGMYLLDEGAAFVRGPMCSWAAREAIECFELFKMVHENVSYRESLKLKGGDNIELAAGKRPTLRETAEAWRRRELEPAD